MIELNPCKDHESYNPSCQECFTLNSPKAPGAAQKTGESMSIEATLEERGNRYGDFSDHARIAQGLQRVMQKAERQSPVTGQKARPLAWDCLDDVKRQALTVIADKIARILSGDPSYADNWHDIQGYAKLVEDRLKVEEEKAL